MSRVNQTAITATLLYMSIIVGWSTPIDDFRDPALDTAQTIDFDNYVENGYLNDFSVGIVNFHDENRYGGNYGASDAFLPLESGRHISLHRSAYITFDGGVKAVAFLLGALNDVWFIDAYSESSVVIESIEIEDSCCGPRVFGFSDINIFELRLRSLSNSDVAVMDNFKYVQIPEPAILSLAVVGIAASITGFRSFREQ
jgi:hypothetical protein